MTFKREAACRRNVQKLGNRWRVIRPKKPTDRRSERGKRRNIYIEKTSSTLNLLINYPRNDVPGEQTGKKRSQNNLNRTSERKETDEWTKRTTPNQTGKA